jgi:hypothetical protein
VLKINVWCGVDIKGHLHSQAGTNSIYKERKEAVRAKAKWERSSRALRQLSEPFDKSQLLSDVGTSKEESLLSLFIYLFFSFSYF